MKKLEKLKLNELENSTIVLQRDEADIIKGGAGGTIFVTGSTFVPSYGIPDHGLLASYNQVVNCAIDSSGNLIIGCIATDSSADYVGAAAIYINGSLAKTIALDNSSNGAYTPTGYEGVGTGAFDVSQYSSDATIYVKVTTQQTIDGYQNYNSGTTSLYVR